MKLIVILIINTKEPIVWKNKEGETREINRKQDTGNFYTLNHNSRNR